MVFNEVVMVVIIKFISLINFKGREYVLRIRVIVLFICLVMILRIFGFFGGFSLLGLYCWSFFDIFLFDRLEVVLFFKVLRILLERVVWGLKGRGEFDIVVLLVLVWLISCFLFVFDCFFLEDIV